METKYNNNNKKDDRNGKRKEYDCKIHTKCEQKCSKQMQMEEKITNSDGDGDRQKERKKKLTWEKIDNNWNKAEKAHEFLISVPICVSAYVCGLCENRLAEWDSARTIWIYLNGKNTERERERERKRSFTICVIDITKVTLLSVAHHKWLWLIIHVFSSHTQKLFFNMPLTIGKRSTWSHSSSFFSTRRKVQNCELYFWCCFQIEISI